MTNNNHSTPNPKQHTLSAGRVLAFLCQQQSGAPLVVFRFAFGVMMFLSALRFITNGWVEALYIKPTYFFTYYGFEWIHPLNATGMYLVFGVMMLAAVGIATGIAYRLSAVLFFVLFTYVELLDKTNYLNHYYFISIMGMLLCLLPATGNIFKLKNGLPQVPRWAILTLQLQMATVYFFAGVAKINTDWLLHTMPLQIWLPTKTELPVIGPLLGIPAVAYIFSWCGMLFDVLIAFFLFNRRTVWYAYAVVVVFHVLTAILFPGIGMFPFIMIVCATVFLPASFHQKTVGVFLKRNNELPDTAIPSSTFNLQYVIIALLVLHFTVQAVLPFRYALYPGKLFVHEQGFRFSWRVMLMEKAGIVFFRVKTNTGKTIEINNRDYLTAQQEKQMSTQPDMIWQFAQHLKTIYHTNEVYAEAYVTVNGRGSRLFIDPTVNLAAEADGFGNKKWILASAQ
ncbi:MAG: hypothetical protein RLZZ367_1429 [Bacteroidota bacterium]